MMSPGDIPGPCATEKSLVVHTFHPRIIRVALKAYPLAGQTSIRKSRRTGCLAGVEPPASRAANPERASALPWKVSLGRLCWDGLA